jgi:DNA-binding PadR family transcriptional regulator
MTTEKMTPMMRDILSAAEGSPDLWLPAKGAHGSIASAMAEYGWIEARPRDDRVYIQLTDAGRAALARKA